MSEPSFLDWYPRGRLAFLSSKQSKDLKNRIEFSESIISALSVFIKVRSDLQTILDDGSLHGKNADFPLVRLPSAFHISPNPEYSSSSKLPEGSRSCLLLTDYVCRFSGELFSQLVQHSIFQKALAEYPVLVSLSGSQILTFDRAIYTIDLGQGDDQLMIESAFPPAHFDPSLEMQEFSEETIFIDPVGATSAFINRYGHAAIFPVVATSPFFSKFSDENKKSIYEFFEENILHLTRLLEAQTLIFRNLSEYFSRGFESSVYLLKNREAVF